MLECLSRSTDVCLSSAPSNQEENSQSKAKGKQTSPPASKIRKRRGFFERSGVKVSAHRSGFQSVLNAFLHSCEVFCGSQMYLSLRSFLRVAFACSVCKFRSFYSEDMATHLESKFHKDHFKFLASQLSKPTTDFLQVQMLHFDSKLFLFEIFQNYGNCRPYFVYHIEW